MRMIRIMMNTITPLNAGAKEATMHPDPHPRGRHALVDHWLKLQIQVRCALDPRQLARVRAYLNTGLQIARLGVLPAERVHLRMLHNLLQAAHDPALPEYWRCACLEHLAQPLAGVRLMLAVRDPLALQAIEAAVDVARERLTPPHCNGSAC